MIKVSKLYISFSLEELSRTIRNKFGDPFIHGSSCSLELVRVGGLGGIELSAVAAIVAVADHGDLVKFRSVLALSSPLPRVFTAVSEENIRACSIKTSLVDRSLLGSGEVRHV